MRLSCRIKELLVTIAHFLLQPRCVHCIHAPCVTLSFARPLCHLLLRTPPVSPSPSHTSFVILCFVLCRAFLQCNVHSFYSQSLLYFLLLISPFSRCIHSLIPHITILLLTFFHSFLFLSYLLPSCPSISFY